MGFSWHFPRTRTSRRRLELAFYLVVAASLAGWALLDNVGLGQRSLAQRPLTAAPAALKSSTNRNATRPSGQKRFATRPIEQVQVGDRTLGENPRRDQVDKSLPEPDPAGWRKISLHLVKQSGRSLWVDFLRPLEWLEQNAVQAGGHVWLDLPEMGAVGNAEVLAVGPCPAIKPGKGHVVTGKFTHEVDANIMQLGLEGQAAATGVTENHLYWSVDREEFIPAGQLREGERVNSAAGPVRVTSVSGTAYEGFVHNLEVHGEHVYRVDRTACLVHNMCARLPGWSAVEQATAARFEAQEGIKLIENTTGNGSADAFWRLDSGRVAHVDFIGNPEAFQPGRWPGNFLNQLERHATIHDFTILDLTGASETQIYQILDKIYSLPIGKQGGIIITGW